MPSDSRPIKLSPQLEELDRRNRERTAELARAIAEHICPHCRKPMRESYEMVGEASRARKGVQ